MSAQIPSTAGVADPSARRVLDPMKEVVESIAGRRGAKITALPSTATLDDAIAKINEVIARLQG